MKQFQKRVVREKKDLDIKITALVKFLNTSASDRVDDEERQRLLDQLHHMKKYSTILGSRMEAFNNGE